MSEDCVPGHLAEVRVEWREQGSAGTLASVRFRTRG